MCPEVFSSVQEQKMTEKVYQKERYMKEMKAEVVSVNGADVVLDRTIFASDAGGQPCDLGTINGYRVKNVTEKDGEFIHTLAKADEAAALAPGDTVELKIDWGRRFDHMQNHLGEHILSGVFKSEYNLDNHGFHLGDDDGTFDLDTLELTDEMIDHAEDLANQAVYDALPVEVAFAETREEAEKYPLRKQLTVDSDILVVTVPGVDCVACCCPHVANTSEIGIIKITGTEKYKQLTRVHFKCGKRAFLDYRQKHKDVAALSERYSADEFTLLSKIEKAEKKQDKIRKEYNDFKTGMAEAYAKKLSAGAPAVITGEIDGADMDLLRITAKKLSEITDAPAVLSSPDAMSVLLTSAKGSPVNCGKIVKNFAEGGRGGGGDTQAQVVFKDAGQMRNFVEKAAAGARQALAESEN
jgi:alanyl-tRNA synthetase